MMAVGCKDVGSPENQLKCMRELPFTLAMNLTRTMQNKRPLDLLWCDRHDWKPTFHHVVDGTVVPYQVQDALRRGKFNKGIVCNPARLPCS